MYTITRGPAVLFTGPARLVYLFLVRAGGLDPCSGITVLLPDGQPTCGSHWRYFE